MSEVYPTHKLKEKFRPIRDVKLEYNIEESVISNLVSQGKVMYALMKDPVGTKRIPHINLEQLLQELGVENIE